MCSGSTAAPQQDGCSELREWQVLKTGEGAEPKPNVAGIFLPGIAGKTAAEVIFFPFHLFLQRLTAEGEAAAAFNSLLPPQEVFGSAPFTPPPFLPCLLHMSRSRSRFGIIGSQPLVLDSPVASHRALPAISQRPLPASLSFFFFFGVRINKWKLLFFTLCLAAVRSCSGSPVACYILLSTSCCFAGESSQRGKVSHLPVESHLSCLFVSRI